MKAFGAAAQNDSIARLQAQCTGVRCYIWAAFIDDADDAQRCSDTFDVQPAGLIPFSQYFSDRIILQRDTAQTVTNALNAVFGQQQPIHHGIG